MPKRMFSEDSAVVLHPTHYRGTDSHYETYNPQAFSQPRVVKEEVPWQEKAYVSAPENVVNYTLLPGAAAIAAHPMDIAALQAQAEFLEMQTRLHNEEAQREAETQRRQMFDGKGHRSTHACEHCRQRKAKCTGDQPCTRCTKQGKMCQFSQVYKNRKVSTSPNQLTKSSKFAPKMVMPWMGSAVRQSPYGAGAGAGGFAAHHRPTIPNYLNIPGAYPATRNAPGHQAVTLHASLTGPSLGGHPDDLVMAHSGSFLAINGQFDPFRAATDAPSSHSLPVSPGVASFDGMSVSPTVLDRSSSCDNQKQTGVPASLSSRSVSSSNSGYNHVRGASSGSNLHYDASGNMLGGSAGPYPTVNLTRQPYLPSYSPSSEADSSLLMLPNAADSVYPPHATSGSSLPRQAFPNDMTGMLPNSSVNETPCPSTARRVSTTTGSPRQANTDANTCADIDRATPAYWNGLGTPSSVEEAWPVQRKVRTFLTTPQPVSPIDSVNSL